MTITNIYFVTWQKDSNKQDFNICKLIVILIKPEINKNIIKSKIQYKKDSNNQDLNICKLIVILIKPEINIKMVIE